MIASPNDRSAAAKKTPTAKSLFERLCALVPYSGGCASLWRQSCSFAALSIQPQISVFRSPSKGKRPIAPRREGRKAKGVCHLRPLCATRRVINRMRRRRPCEARSFHSYLHLRISPKTRRRLRWISSPFRRHRKSAPELNPSAKNKIRKASEATTRCLLSPTYSLSHSRPPRSKAGIHAPSVSWCWPRKRRDN